MMVQISFTILANKWRCGVKFQDINDTQYDEQTDLIFFIQDT